MRKESFLKAIIERRPIACSVCRGKLKYTGAGYYECIECGHEELDDFGKVKEYVDKYGPSPAPVISNVTGVPLDIINGMLRDGRLEIPEGSQVFLECEKCGCSIRYGRFCPECINETVKGLMGAYFNPDVGERPQRQMSKEENRRNRMRFLGMEDK